MSSSSVFTSALVLAALALLLGLGPVPTALAQDAPARDRASVPSILQRGTQALSPALRTQVARAVHGPDRTGKDGPMAPVGGRLAALYYQHEAGGTAGVKRLTGGADVRQTKRARYRSPVSADGRFVTIDAVASGAPSRLLGDLRALGLRDGATADNVVSGRLPISALRAAAQLATLRGASAAAFRTHVGSVNSEADTAHAALEGRANLGVDGSGEKICALSDSYDASSNGSASSDVSSGDLPSDVEVFDDPSSGTDEGRAMLQLIHDIAPGADLGFHTAEGGVADFADAIRELGDPNQGNCSVIVDDIIYNTEPFYQDGPVSNAVDDVVNTDGVTYFSSAGNNGQNSYTSAFRETSQDGIISASSTRHDFDPSGTTDTKQKITVDPGGSFRIFTFQWTDPSAQVSTVGADTDLDIALDSSGVIVASSAQNSDEDGNGVPVEGSIEYENTTGTSVTLNLVVEMADGPAPDSIKYLYDGSGYTIVDDYGDAQSPTVYGHPMAEGAMAVAAAPYYATRGTYGCTQCPRLEDFSSKGGIPILFDQSGSRVSATVRPKPDVTGTDGVDNTFFGNDISFAGDTDSHPNFFGTSAAAPNVAAIAALIQEVHPTFAPADVYGQLESTAIDVQYRDTPGGSTASVASGVDPWGGHGFVLADAASLPVELARFEATASGASALLTWTTASETNNAGFVVEHRAGDGAFERIGYRDGAGTTTESQRYRYRTSRLAAGPHTFRLRQVDLDGRTTHSRTARVRVGPTGAYSVSGVAPNPVRSTGTVTVTVKQAQTVRAAVYDALGRRVAVLHDAPLPAHEPTTLRVGAGLPSGVYVLRAEGASFEATRKFVRVR